MMRGALIALLLSYGTVQTSPQSAVITTLSDESLTGEVGIRPLTPVTLSEALTIGASDEGASKIPNYSIPLAAFVKARGMARIVADPALNAQFKAMMEGPYAVTIVSPYVSAMIEAAEAKRKYLDPPKLSVDQLNAAGVRVRVAAGRTFTNLGTIETVIIKRAGQIVRPLTADVKPTVVQNRLGATASSAEGSFTFGFSAFEPSTPITLVLIGKEGNFEWDMTPAELRLLR